MKLKCFFCNLFFELNTPFWTTTMDEPQHKNKPCLSFFYYKTFQPMVDNSTLIEVVIPKESQ